MEECILIRPMSEYASQIVEYRQEFLDAGDSMDGCGPLRRIENPEEYIKVCMDYEDPVTVPSHLVPATQFFLIRKSDNRLVGMLQVRHCFNDFLEKYAGHIGYSVRPSERRRGYAKEMLKMALPFCSEIGLDKVLITCIDGNIGSEKTILGNGGVYESTVHEPNENVDLKRFWIELPNHRRNCVDLHDGCRSFVQNGENLM
ncbi:MAG: GNAT family N-acetyltransferase [Fusicatenibacter sp.]